MENIQRNALYSTHPCRSYIVDRWHLVSMCCHNHYESYMYLVLHHLQMQILNNGSKFNKGQESRDIIKISKQCIKVVTMVRRR